MNPILLEINYTPSFATDTPLDWKIKKDLIKDTLSLLEITREMKEKTVKERKEIRGIRMRTGKKNKLTSEERANTNREVQRNREE